MWCRASWSAGAARAATTGSIMEGLLTMLLSDKIGVNLSTQASTPRSPEAEALREEIRQSMLKTSQPQAAEPPKTGDEPKAGEAAPAPTAGK